MCYTGMASLTIVPVAAYNVLRARLGYASHRRNVAVHAKGTRQRYTPKVHAKGITMPAERIKDILDEIGTLTQNPHIRELAVELGTLLAANTAKIANNAASINRLKETTTNAIVDTEATLKDHITDLRTAILGLTQLYQRRMTAIEERNETITGRVHTLANHMMAVEQKVNELAEIVTLVSEQLLEFDYTGNEYSLGADRLGADRLGADPHDELIDPYSS